MNSSGLPYEGADICYPPYKIVHAAKNSRSCAEYLLLRQSVLSIADSTMEAQPTPEKALEENYINHQKLDPTTGGRFVVASQKVFCFEFVDFSQFVYFVFRNFSFFI